MLVIADTLNEPSPINNILFLSLRRDRANIYGFIVYSGVWLGFFASSYTMLHTVYWVHTVYMSNCFMNLLASVILIHVAFNHVAFFIVKKSISLFLMQIFQHSIT